MPRTKAIKKKDNKTNDFTNIVSEKLSQTKKALDEEYDQMCADYLKNLEYHLNEIQLSIPAEILSKTVGEVQNSYPNESTVRTNASVMQLLNATKTVSKSRTLLRRSISCGDDEGERKSRARERPQRTTRVSRSLSTRTQTKTSTAARYKTPVGRQPPAATYGTVTPKITPNTPQVLLRRPNVGEVALSLQGSPLFTGSVVTEKYSHVNIPLENGRLLSIQPQSGLRMSQIPKIDPETKRQLEMLRDNLNKMCAANSNR